MRKYFPAVLIVAAFAFSLLVFERLPERMVTHWNVRGEPDGYSARAFGAFLMPGIMLILWLVLLAVPHIDPRHTNIEKFRDSYETLIVAIVSVMAGLHVVLIGAALGWPIPIARIVPFGVGVLLVVLGNLLPRFRSNFFMGIRTPWTLSSETVWARTHRVGGYMIVGAGIMLIISAFVHSTTFSTIAFASVVAAALATLIYSYVIWRAETH